MLTAVDHLVLGVPDVTQAAETYRNLGFAVGRSSGAKDGGDEAAHVVFGDFYIEFQELRPTEGTHRIVVRSDDLEAEVARLRSRGFSVSDPVERPRGSQLSRTSLVDSDIPIGLIEHRQSAHAGPAFAGDAPSHPNTATVLERTYFAVESIEEKLETFEKLLGMPAPEPEMGMVIMSMMSVFYFGEIGIAVAEPRGSGPTADALSANGPGLFQLLFRAGHLERAATLMVDNGLSPPTQGTRLSGERALLVEPAHACGLFVAFAGPP